jgi:hypothetical protein
MLQKHLHMKQPATHKPSRTNTINAASQASCSSATSRDTSSLLSTALLLSTPRPASSAFNCDTRSADTSATLPGAPSALLSPVAGSCCQHLQGKRTSRCCCWLLLIARPWCLLRLQEHLITCSLSGACTPPCAAASARWSTVGRSTMRPHSGCTSWSLPAPHCHPQGRCTAARQQHS